MSVNAISQNIRDLAVITAPTVAVSLLSRMGIGNLLVQREIASSKTVALGAGIVASLAVGGTLYKLGQYVLLEKRDPKKTTSQKLLKTTLMTTQVALVMTLCMCVAYPRPPFDNKPRESGIWAWHIQGCQHGRRGQMDGPCDGKRVVEKLLNHPDLPSGIIFEPHRLNSDLRFGTCSAMSLDFGNEVLSRCMGQSDVESVECLKGIAENYRTSGRKFRDIQAGLNTIGALIHRGSDVMFKKAAALACYWDLKIVEALPPFLPPDFTASRLGDTEIVADIVNASEGVHFIRSIRNQLSNRKAEFCGHSTLLIKLGNVLAYFDPNRGLFIADAAKASVSDFAKSVRNLLAEDSREWKLGCQRLYLLTKE